MSAVLKIIAAIAVMVVLCGGGFFLGTNSVQPELRAAERRGDSLKTDLKAVERDLADTVAELDEVQSELTEVRSELASCDGDAATKIFTDLMAVHGEFLRQYRRYLGNDELIFLFDFDTTDEFQDGYSGNNSMIDQFNTALDSCVDGEGADA